MTKKTTKKKKNEPGKAPAVTYHEKQLKNDVKNIKDELGMAPAVHRKKLENDIESVHDRIDILIEDFGDQIAEMKKKLDKVCSRLGLPLS